MLKILGEDEFAHERKIPLIKHHDKEIYSSLTKSKGSDFGKREYIEKHRYK